MLVETAVPADAEEVLHFWETVDREKKEIFQNLSFLWTSNYFYASSNHSVVTHSFTYSHTLLLKVTDDAF